MKRTHYCLISIVNDTSYSLISSITAHLPPNGLTTPAGTTQERNDNCIVCMVHSSTFWYSLPPFHPSIGFQWILFSHLISAQFLVTDRLQMPPGYRPATLKDAERHPHNLERALRGMRIKDYEVKSEYLYVKGFSLPVLVQKNAQGNCWDYLGKGKFGEFKEIGGNWRKFWGDIWGKLEKI